MLPNSHRDRDPRAGGVLTRTSRLTVKPVLISTIAKTAAHSQWRARSGASRSPHAISRWGHPSGIDKSGRGEAKANEVAYRMDHGRLILTCIIVPTYLVFGPGDIQAASPLHHTLYYLLN